MKITPKNKYIFLLILGIISLRIYTKLMPIPAYAHSYCQKGIDQEDQKNTNKAARYYQKAIYHNPLHSEANFRMGVIYGEQGKKKKRLECFKKIVASHANPHVYSNAYSTVGIDYFHQKDYAKAIELFKKASSVRGSPEIYYYLGRAYRLTGNHKEAKASINLMWGIIGEANIRRANISPFHTPWQDYDRRK